MAELEGSYNREVIAPSRYADTVNLFCILILQVAIWSVKILYIC